MRFHWGFSAGLLVLASCGGDSSGLTGEKVQKGEQEGRQINGQVVSIAFQPESSFVGVAGAQITVWQTSSDSGDTSVVHPDSMVPLMNRGRPFFGDSSWIDTIPHDSTWHPPVDTLLPPIDTLSPPPSHRCGDGHPVATAVTDAQGHFTISGLGAGTYDLVALPPVGYWGGVSCYVDLRTRPSTDVQIFVAPRGDSVFHGLD